ncbi:MAG: hypothetical protein HY716_13240 [Planctomycetes bacterium]|nr:hypothetical protein [Planctomycetota bacterium]
MELNGFSAEQLKEAARVVSVGASFSTYFAGIEYPVEKFREELGAAVEYIKKQKK